MRAKFDSNLNEMQYHKPLTQNQSISIISPAPNNFLPRQEGIETFSGRQKKDDTLILPKVPEGFQGQHVLKSEINSNNFRSYGSTNISQPVTMQSRAN